MAKVEFEFDENEDREDINVIVNRHKLVCAVNELSDFYSQIYNGKIYDPQDTVYVKADGQIATQEDYDKANLEGRFLSGGKTYLRQEFVERELDRILDGIRQFLYY